MSDASGRLTAALADRYAIERELGGGGMSRVFLARETALGREVVVKVLAEELAAGVSAERFTREIATAARLQQANIVPVLSAGDAAGVPYYIMPFVRGESLRARLASGTALSMAERVNILRDVARALAYAHGEGVVHRDIKPENVLLSHGTAVVTDFGIAKAINAARTQEGGGAVTLTQAGGSIGTPMYMAPEQAAGDTVDHRTDLYAWGLLGYELLAGGHPFARHTSPQALITAQLTEPPAPFKPTDGVPAALATLVLRCLEKDPKRRPGSAAELLTALDQLSTSGGGPAHPAPSRWTRSRFGLLAAAILGLGGLGVWLGFRDRGAAPAAASTEKSLAVLPFESVGGDTANAYFAEGIGDELTTALARLPGLRVAGRSSAMRFKGKGASAQEIGATLGVTSVLDGRVRRAGGRVRVTAQLTSASDGLVQWSETYEREASDVFALQDDITRAIVSALQVRLASGSTPALAGAGTTNLEAYDLYLRGLYLLRRRGSALVRAAELLEQAIAKDSTFARAHAALATVLLTQVYYLPVNVPEQARRARAIAERAVALDPNLSEAHQALGTSHNTTSEWDISVREQRKAIALDPNSVEPLYRLGFVLITTGQVAEAIKVLQSGKVVDPLYPLVASYLGYGLALAGHAEAAVAEAERAVELDSTNLATQTVLGFVYRIAGQPAKALRVAQGSIRTDQRRFGMVAYLHAYAGDTAETRRIGARLEALPANTQGRNSGLAMVYLGLGDTARALTAMERAAGMAAGDLLFFTVPSDPAFDPVRASPRFAAVLKRFNLDVALLSQPGGGRPKQ